MTSFIDDPKMQVNKAMEENTFFSFNKLSYEYFCQKVLCFAESFFLQIAFSQHELNIQHFCVSIENMYFFEE